MGKLDDKKQEDTSLLKVDETTLEPDSDEELGDSQFYHDAPELPAPTTVAHVTRAFNNDGSIRKIIRAKKSDFVHNLIYLDGKKFDFTGREYLEPIYNRKDRDILLKTARQVEKCSRLGTPVLLADGSERAVEELLPGDRVAAIGPDGHQTSDTVIASESNGTKRCVRVKTRLGSSLEVTLNHPVRKLLGWHQAGALCVGDRIAALRTLGNFGTTSEPLAALLGLMIGDGSMTDGCRRFTAKTPEVQQWFERLNGPTTSKVDERSGTSNYYVGQSAPITEFFRSRGIFGKTAHEKELPAECFSYNESSTRELLRGLWATDGHCKNVTPSKVDLVYCTTSAVLARQIRLLLRKFGVVTVQRQNQPSNGGRLAYIIRVVTRRSVEAFYRHVGPIPGKPFTLSSSKSSSNLDTLPKEVHELVVAARKAKDTYWQRDGFQANGQRINRCYAPTFEKIAAQNRLLQDETLDVILQADIVWDEVTSIEDIGDHPTWGIQTATETYVSDFIVNHNTTFLANNLVVSSVVLPYNKSLYVSPSHTQTRQFSNEKLRPAIEKSPFIRKYFQDHAVSTQVFEKGFTNGSYVFLRSAFRSADRTRGISARNLCYDKDAFVLTRAGWKPVSELTTDDEVADVNDAGTVEWNRPSRVIRQRHSGEMVTFRHGGFHLRVTGDHRMWVNFRVKHLPANRRKDEYEFCSAEELVRRKYTGFKMTCGADWDEVESETVAVEGSEYVLLPFYALVGWYLAEGCISGGYPILNISERDLPHVVPILVALGLRYDVYDHSHNADGPGRTLWVFSKPLGRYFKTLGKSYTKHIPRELFASPAGLRELLKGLYLGDACYHKGERWDHGTLRTRSKQLALDVQEAWLRLRRPAAVHTRMTPNKALNLTPGADYKLVPLYEVCAYDLDYMVFWGAERKRRLLVEQVEDEEVYCFTVKNHRPIVKGNLGSKPVVCGQCLDEIQDFLGSEIPVIMECTSHFHDAMRLMAGTPKSLDNPIETYWQETSQNEWLVPCRACGKWNFLDETNIGPTEWYINGKLPPGPICKKCQRPINIREGRWFSTCSGKQIQGYRIPQLMVPWIVGLYDQWLRILWKRDNYPLGQLYNEVLGLSYDSASKPITRDELIELCQSYDLWDPDNLSPRVIGESKKYMLTAGVDWGEGNDGSEKSPSGKIRNASYTVLTIGTYLNQKTWAVKLVKKYQGKEIDPDFVVKDIARICGTLGVKLCGVDWGHGWGVNNHLVRLLGANRVVQFQYLPKLKQRMKWDPLGFRYHLQRNFMMSELFFDMKQGFVQFPRWQQIEPYAKDILAIYAEYVEFRREIKYDHRPTDPDDFFHSMHYAKLTSDIFTGKSRRYTMDIPHDG